MIVALAGGVGAPVQYGDLGHHVPDRQECFNRRFPDPVRRGAVQPGGKCPLAALFP